MTIQEIVDAKIQESLSLNGLAREMDASDGALTELAIELASRSTSNHLRDDGVHEFFGGDGGTWRIHLCVQ